MTLEQVQMFVEDVRITIDQWKELGIETPTSGDFAELAIITLDNAIRQDDHEILDDFAAEYT